MSSGHRIRIKAYKVKPGAKKGKPILEEIPGYGKDASAKIRAQHSNKVRVVKPTPSA